MNLIEMTLDAAVEALAKRAADLRTRPLSYQEKRAAGLSDVLTSVGQQVKENPYLQHSLLGAGLGAGVGGLSTVLGNQGKEDKDRRSVVQSMLTGGLAGGAIGGGVSLAGKMFGSKPPEGGVDAMKPGQFKDPTTGKMMQVDPEMLRRNPALAGKVRELSQPMDPINRGLTTATNTITRLGTRFIPGLTSLTDATGLTDKDDWLNSAIDRNLPITSRVLPAVATADMLSNSPRLQTGNIFGYGYVDPRTANNPDMLTEGLKAHKGNVEGGQAKAYEELLGNRDRINQIAADRTGRGADAAGDVHKVTETTPGDPIKQPAAKKEVFEDVTEPGTGKNLGQRKKEVYVPQPDLPGPPKTTEHKVTREDMHQRMSEGVHAQAGKANKAHGLDHEIPRVFRRPGMTDSHVGSMFSGGRGLRRLGAYGLPVLAEYSLSQLRGQGQRETDLRELMRRAAKEVK